LRTPCKLILLNILDVQHCGLAIARGCQKTGESPETSDVLPCQALGHCSKSNRLHGGLDFARGACLGLPGLVFESQRDGGQSGGRVTQGLSLCDTGGQGYAVLHSNEDGSAVAAIRTVATLTAFATGSCVLSLAGLAGLFALDSLHHGRWARIGLLLLNRQVAQHGVVELEGVLQFSHHGLVGFDVERLQSGDGDGRRPAAR